MTEPNCSMPIAVINPWNMAPRRMVMVNDHHDTAAVIANGWEILRGVRMYVDKDGVVQVEP